MSERKINLEEIINDELYNQHLIFDRVNSEQIKNICLEFGKQLLELAAKNAKIISNCSEEPINWNALLNTIKQVE